MEPRSLMERAPSCEPGDRIWLEEKLRAFEHSPALVSEEVARQRPDLAPLFNEMIGRMLSNLPTAGMETQKPSGHSFRPGDLISNRYCVIAEVGQGGMGSVYEVADRYLPERGSLALKTIRGELASDPAMVARFEREVRLSLCVAHENVCRTFDIGRHGEGEAATVYLTMEFLRGGRLADLLKDGNGRRAVPEKEAWPLFRQMVDGLAAIHAHNIIHRDFKPANVMLAKTSSGWRVAITDLGLARALDETSFTEPGYIMGTPGYIAPEGSGTQAADVYALGVTMIEMLTGKRMEAGDPEHALRERGVSPWLRSVVAKCCAADPHRRYRDAGEVARAFERDYERTKSAVETARGSFASPASPARRRWLAAGSVGALVALVGFSASQFMKPRVPPRALELTASAADRMANNSFLDASRILEQVVAAAPHYALAHAMLADADNELELTGRSNREMNCIDAADLRAATSDERMYIEGVRLTLTRDYAGAAGRFRSYYGKSGAASAPGRAVLLGRALEKAQRPAEAAKAYASAGKRGGALLSMAVLDSRQQQIPKALSEFDEARTQFQALGEHGAMAGLQYQLGAAYNRWGRLAEGEAALRSCADQARVVGDEYDALRCRQQLATIALRRAQADEDFAAARRELTEVIDDAGRQGFQALQARAWLSLGQTYVLRDSFTDAEHSFTEASARAESEQAARVKALIDMARADLHLRTRRPQLAEPEAAAAAVFFRQDGALKELSQALLLEGRALLDQQRPDDALKMFSEQREVAAKVSPGDEAKALEAIGQVYEYEENYPAAAAQFRHALELAGSGLDALYYRVHISRMLAELGQWREAREVLGTVARAGLPPGLRVPLSLALAQIDLVSGGAVRVRGELSGPDAAEPEFLTLRGEADLLQRNFRAAQTECKTALEAALGTQDRQEVSASAACLAEAALGAGSAQESLDVLSRYESEWTTLPVERWRGLAVRSACLMAAGRKDQAKASLEGAKSAVSGLIALWGPRDFQSYQNRADIRGNRILINIGFGVKK